MATFSLMRDILEMKKDFQEKYQEVKEGVKKEPTRILLKAKIVKEQKMFLEEFK